MALKDIIGQDGALRILFGTLKKQKMPSALLFSGDEGIGKKTTSLNYAKAINCANPRGIDCCDNCYSCRKINSWTHPDIKIILPEKNEIRIEEIRELEEFLSFTAFEGKGKIVIIDEAETMNINAVSAFLKTLEEPPKDTYIILLSSRMDDLLDTIKSRCINIRFNPLSTEDCKKIANQLMIENIEDFVRISMGHPGLVISKSIGDKRKWVMNIYEDMIKNENRNEWKDLEEIRLWIDLVFIFLRDLIVFDITDKKEDLIFGNFLKIKNIKDVIEGYEKLQRFKNLIDLNLNKKISWNYIATIMSNITR